MRRFLLNLAERLARDPALHARIHASLDSVRENSTRRQLGNRVIDHANPSLMRTAPSQGPADGKRAANLIWVIGFSLLMFWMVLIGGAFGLWAVFGDWAITQVNGVSRGTGLPAELAGPIASTAKFIKDFIGPILSVIGVAGSAVILVITALAARLLGQPKG